MQFKLSVLNVLMTEKIRISAKMSLNKADREDDVLIQTTNMKTYLFLKYKIGV